MVLPMGKLDNVPDDVDWDDAFSRVESYLVALRLKNRRIISRLVFQILDRAAERLCSEPTRNPTESAMEEANRILVDWYSYVLDVEVPLGRIPTQGNLAMLLADAPEKWPRYYLEPPPYPNKFLKSLRKTYKVAVPDFQKRFMASKELKLTVPASALAGTINLVKRWPVVGLVLNWIIIIGGLAALFYFTR